MKHCVLYSTFQWLFIAFFFSDCASRPPANSNTVGAYAVLKSRSGIKSVTVVEMATRKPLYNFTKGQCDSLKMVLKVASVSESLLFTPSPWEIALVIQADADTPFVLLYYRDVLRVNASYPWTTRIADSSGAIAPGIADIVLVGDSDSWDGVFWLYNLMHSIMIEEPSKSYRGHQMLPMKKPN